jgi:hypothetical protein
MPGGRFVFRPGVRRVPPASLAFQEQIRIFVELAVALPPIRLVQSESDSKNRGD